MVIPPIYSITPTMLELVAQIDTLLYYFSTIDIPQLVNEKILRVSFLKSSLYSARIEGNPLTLETIYNSDDKFRQKEVENILIAMKFINKEIRSRTEISKDTLLQLHQIVMKDLHGQAGQFRHEMSAIFNQAGIAVYVPPAPEKISSFVDKLLAYINSDTEQFPLVCAFISHLIFEKIHPFIDGNGRVGRLLITSILHAKKKKTTIFVPYEEYLDEHKDEYYYYLDAGLSKTNDYLLFMLKGFFEQIQKIREHISKELAKKESILLPPRQEEIYHIINDHTIVSFDFLKRRFLKVPARTLRYDLKRLVDQGIVLKIGKTRGSYYKAKK